MNPTGSAWVFSTFFGGAGDDVANGIALDPAGNVYIVGTTSSFTAFPISDPLPSTSYRGGDVFVAKLDPNASRILYSTFLGTPNSGWGTALAVDSSGNAYVAGDTFSGDFPLVNAFQSTKAAGPTLESFVAKITARLPTAAFLDSNRSVELSLYGLPSLQYGGGSFGSDPAISQDIYGDSIVVARDVTGSLWANIFNADKRTWSNWAFGGGIVQGRPAIATAVNGVTYISARDNWNSYWLTSYSQTSGFGAWAYLSGIFSTDPAMAAAGDGSLYIVGKDNWGAIWSGRYIPGTGFQGWIYGAGILKGQPSVAVGTDNVAYIAARDNWDSLWMGRVQANNWCGWSYGGGIMSADPQVSKLGNETVAVTVLDSGGVIWYRGFA